MHLTDSLNALTSITLPVCGFVPIGEPLPDGLDLSKLQEELRLFYGDRLTLIDPTPPAPIVLVKSALPSEIKPAPKRRKSDGLSAQG